eukprot:jgi/Psemu1/41781/gm1.41781_g
MSRTLLAPITTTKGQKKLYSDLNYRRAKKARQLQERLCLPKEKDLLRILDNNLIKNCFVTRRDVQIMNDIYDRHTGLLKGKTVRTQPAQIQEEIMPVPLFILEQYKEVTLCVNILSYREWDEKYIQVLVGQYALRGFIIKHIHSDNNFECLREDLIQMQPGIQLTCVGAQSHEATIERSKNDEPTAYKKAAETNSDQNGVCGNILVELDIGFQFLECIQAHHGDTNNNSMAPWTDDVVYLRPTGDLTGGFWAYNIDTGRRVRRQKGTSVPMSSAMIEKLEQMAKHDKIWKSRRCTGIL